MIFKLYYSFKTDITCEVKAAVSNLELIKINFVNMTLKKIRLWKFSSLIFIIKMIIVKAKKIFYI